MATHSSILAWIIPWTKEAGRLQSMGSQRVKQDLATKQQQNRHIDYKYKYIYIPPLIMYIYLCNICIHIICINAYIISVLISGYIQSILEACTRIRFS